MSVIFYPLTLSPPSAFLSPTRLPPSAGALAPPPALPGGSRATRRRRIEPRARLRGAEEGQRWPPAGAEADLAAAGPAVAELAAAASLYGAQSCCGELSLAGGSSLLLLLGLGHCRRRRRPISSLPLSRRPARVAGGPARASSGRAGRSGAEGGARGRPGGARCLALHLPLSLRRGRWPRGARATVAAVAEAATYGRYSGRPPVRDGSGWLTGRVPSAERR